MNLLSSINPLISLLYCLISFIILWVVVKVLRAVWLTPMEVEKMLKKQGINSLGYKLVRGNLLTALKLRDEAWSKPMDLSHDIAPRLLPYIVEAVQKHGKWCLTWFGYFPDLLITDPEIVKEVLVNKFGVFERPPMLSSLKPLNPGLLKLEGKVWALHRRIVNPAFHQEKIKGMVPSFSLSCNELIQKWKESVENSKDGSHEADVWEDLQNMTADVISRTAFGSSYEEGNKIFQLQREQFKLLVQSLFKLLIPGMLPTKENLRIKKLTRDIKSMLGAIIDKRLSEMKHGTAAANDDLLGLLMQSNKDMDENGTKGVMTRDEIIEECELFYFAGQETTSVLLTWTMVVLSMHQEWQERAREEVLQVCGNNTPTFDNLTHLKLVTSILYEVLRLYPPAAFIARNTSKEVKLGGVTLPSKVRLLVPLILMHHDRELWGEDAHEFNPERFSAGIANASRQQLAFFPFGHGPRICIGQTFAMLEAKMALATILQNFTFGLSPSYAHAPYMILTTQPQYGAQIILRPNEKSL